MKVKDINIYDDFATVKDETVLQAAKLMKKKDIPDLVLVDNNKKPLGIISSEDIVFKVIAEEKDPKNLTVSGISRSVKSFTEEATTEEIFEYMMESDNEIVPIVNDGGKLLGVCTIGDVAWDDKE